MSLISRKSGHRLQFALNFYLFTLLLTSIEAFDVLNMAPIANSSISTGNKILYEKDNDTASTDDKNYLDVNEIPVRYDEMQLWRIYNISEHMKNNENEPPVALTLEQKFGGVVWKENSKFLDISIGKNDLKAARSYLMENNLFSELLNENVQDVIDKGELMGAQATQSKAGSRTKKAARSGMHWRDYHDVEVIYDFMREIRAKFPHICRLYTIGKTAEGRDLKVLRISENPSKYKKIWIDGGIHAREWISPATVTFILYQIMSNWQSQPPYIKDRTWYFMPVVNPDGYMYSRTKNRLWRKNRSFDENTQCYGVDLNRNFDINWEGAGTSPDPCSAIYRGSSPASEAESSAIVDFLSKRQANLESYLTFHSYGQVMVYPWAYKAVRVKDWAVLKRVASTAVQRIAKKTGADYRAASTHEVLGVAGGGSDDWVRAALGTKYVYTVELRDKGTYGFLLPPDQIQQTALEGWIAVETVAQAIN